MVAVYRLTPDVDEFQSLDPDNLQQAMEYRFDGRSMGLEWKGLGVHCSTEPDLEDPDIWSFLSATGTLAATSEVASLLERFLAPSCELLPLAAKDRGFVLVNVTRVIDCLDTAQSSSAPDLPHWVTEYVFQHDKLDLSIHLFKIPQTRLSEVLNISHCTDPDRDLKAFIEANGITGLRFDLLWNGG